MKNQLLKKLSIYILALTALTFLASCDNFERRFYEKIVQGQLNAIQNGADTFDLATITDFEWDSVILIRGNESVPYFKEEIEAFLQQQKNDVHWVYKTTDLPTNRDRFYFLTPDKKIIEKEIKSGISMHRPAFDFIYCSTDSNNERYWLSKSECQFILTSNSRKAGQGTIFMYPACTNPPAKKEEPNSWTVNEYNKDGLRIDITNHQLKNFSIHISRKNDALTLDLNALHIPFKTPEVIWVNKDFVCISTWWSGPFARNLFIPLGKQLKEYIYIDKDIEWTDSITNNVMYVDTVLNGQVKMILENLKSRKKQLINYPLNPERPPDTYYDSLRLTKKQLTIWSDGKTRSFMLNI